MKIFYQPIPTALLCFLFLKVNDETRYLQIMFHITGTIRMKTEVGDKTCHYFQFDSCSHLRSIEGQALYRSHLSPENCPDSI